MECAAQRLGGTRCQTKEGGKMGLLKPAFTGASDKSSCQICIRVCNRKLLGKMSAWLQHETYGVNFAALALYQNTEYLSII